LKIILNISNQILIAMANKKETSKKEAQLASKVLKSKTASKTAKSLAGSALSQAKGKGGNKS
jgi:hypothetical protein